MAIKKIKLPRIVHSIPRGLQTHVPNQMLPHHQRFRSLRHACLCRWTVKEDRNEVLHEVWPPKEWLFMAFLPNTDRETKFPSFQVLFLGRSSSVPVPPYVSLVNLAVWRVVRQAD